MRYFIYSIIAFIFLSCKNVEGQKVSLSKVNFDKRISPRLHLISKLDSNIECTFFDITHDTLYLTNIQMGNRFFGEIRTVETNNVIAPFLPLGRKEGYLLSVFGSGKKFNKFWAYDITGERIVTADLNTVLQGRAEYHEFKVNEFVYSVGMIDSTRFLLIGNPNNSSKLVLKDLRKDSVVTKLGKYEIGEGFPSKYLGSWILANQGFLTVRPDNRLAAVAYRYTDKVEIFDLKEDKSKIFSGPDFFDIEVTLENDNTPDAYISRNVNTRYAFTSVLSSNNCIYALYRGDLHYLECDESQYSILVYTWDGMPLYRFDVPICVSSFAIDKNENGIYLLEKRSNNLYYFKMNE